MPASHRWQCARRRVSPCPHTSSEIEPKGCESGSWRRCSMSLGSSASERPPQQCQIPDLKVAVQRGGSCLGAGRAAAEQCDHLFFCSAPKAVSACAGGDFCPLAPSSQNRDSPPASGAPLDRPGRTPVSFESKPLCCPRRPAWLECAGYRCANPKAKLGRCAYWALRWLSVHRFSSALWMPVPALAPGVQ